jgi:hypothetical protein
LLRMRSRRASSRVYDDVDVWFQILFNIRQRTRKTVDVGIYRDGSSDGYFLQAY